MPASEITMNTPMAMWARRTYGGEEEIMGVNLLRAESRINTRSHAAEGASLFNCMTERAE